MLMIGCPNTASPTEAGNIPGDATQYNGSSATRVGAAIPIQPEAGKLISAQCARYHPGKDEWLQTDSELAPSESAEADQMKRG